MIFYAIGNTRACSIAADLLRKQGIPSTDHPSPDITHLLLDVPSFRPDGQLRGGGSIEPILQMLPPQVHIIGGNLTAPALEGYSKTDLLKDPCYLAENASITADCAIRLAGTYMEQTFAESPALVIGWGRIGKCLASGLKRLGCRVTVAARKESDRAMLSALRYNSLTPTDIPDQLNRFSLLFNTVPSPILGTPIPSGCIALELASSPGLSAGNIIASQGLPGKMAPVSSGRLIAETILRLSQEDLS